MANYLDIHYSVPEYAPDLYPQKLCNYLIDNVIAPHFDTVEGLSILDVGSGRGNHLVGFARRGMNPCGIDKRDECLAALDSFDIRQCDIENDSFPFQREVFDVVFSKSVIEHVWNADNFVSECSRVLKPGGLLVLMTPDWATQSHFFWDDYTHVKPWTKKGLHNALRLHGFEQVSASYFRQLPILWKYPYLEALAKLTALAPDRFKWKDKDRSKHRPWVRFSKELMILASARKAGSFQRS